ncbi:hypothetical protein A2U01_0105138, partial [Trifolium medium]|nr:hypothetical protein [Trifolium medium]
MPPRVAPAAPVDPVL